jgi:hypothetical protein
MVFPLILAIFCLTVGIAYLANSKFVEWTITNDRRGQQWARLLGRERASYAMRYIFSLVLIIAGMVSLYVAYLNY